MKNTSLLLFVVATFFLAPALHAQMTNKNKSVSPCTNWDCIEKNQNTNTQVQGFFRKYTPNTKGKGANFMFWDWEVLLSDSTAVPLSKINKNIDYKSFEGKKVLVSGNIFYGTIIGGKHEYEQSATGYRIDATEIKKLD